MMSLTDNPPVTLVQLAPTRSERMTSLRELLTRPIIPCNARHEGYAYNETGSLSLLFQCLEEDRHGGCLHLISDTIDGYRGLLLDLLIDSDPDATQLLTSVRVQSKKFDSSIRDSRRRAAYAVHDEQKWDSERQTAEATQQLSVWLHTVWDPLRIRIVEKIDAQLQRSAVDQNATE